MYGPESSRRLHMSPPKYAPSVIKPPANHSQYCVFSYDFVCMWTVDTSCRVSQDKFQWLIGLPTSSMRKIAYIRCVLVSVMANFTASPTCSTLKVEESLKNYTSHQHLVLELVTRRLAWCLFINKHGTFPPRNHTKSPLSVLPLTVCLAWRESTTLCLFITFPAAPSILSPTRYKVTSISMLRLPYPSGPFTPPSYVGGSCGREFSTYGWITHKQALVVQRLQVWWDTRCITAIQLTYADGSVSDIFGQTSGTNDSLTLAPGERITSFILWDNGKGDNGTRIGRIRMNTSQGQTFDVGKDTSGQPSYTQPIGAGILVGMVGRCGSDVDLLGAVFLNSKVTAVAIDNVEYDNEAFLPLSRVVLSQVHYKGAPVDGTNWTFSNSVSRTTPQSFNQTSATMFGPSVRATVTASVFGIGGSVESNLQWQSTLSSETSTSTTQEVGFTWGVSGHLPPDKGLTCTVMTGMGLCNNIRYTCRVKVTLSDGTVNSYSEDGIFNSIVYSLAWVIQVPDVNAKPWFPIERPRAA